VVVERGTANAYIQSWINTRTFASGIPVHSHTLGAVARVIARSLFAPQRVLLLGLGGGAIPALVMHRCAACSFVGVDLSAEAVEITRRLVLPDDGTTRVEYVHADALEYLDRLSSAAHSRGSFDVVINDMYAGAEPIGRESRVLRLVRRLLRADGLYAANFIADHADDVPRLAVAAREVFGNVHVEPVASATNYWLMSER
jgi:spermidine synthase